MVKYEVTVFTADLAASGTLNKVFIKLVGTDGESERKWLMTKAGFTVSCPTSIGKLVLIEVDKQPLPLCPEDSWFPAKVVVKSPEGHIYNFPIYRWITDGDVHRFREGTALRVFDDDHHLSRYAREQELKQRQEDYRWDVYLEGIPHCIKAKNPLLLPCEVRFSFTKTTEFLFTASTGLAELGLKGLTFYKRRWKDIDDISNVFYCKKTSKSGTVQWCKVTNYKYFVILLK